MRHFKIQVSRQYNKQIRFTYSTKLKVIYGITKNYGIIIKETFDTKNHK